MNEPMSGRWIEEVEAELTRLREEVVNLTHALEAERNEAKYVASLESELADWRAGRKVSQTYNDGWRDGLERFLSDLSAAPQWDNVYGTAHEVIRMAEGE